MKNSRCTEELMVFAVKPIGLGRCEKRGTTLNLPGGKKTG